MIDHSMFSYKPDLRVGRRVMNECICMFSCAMNLSSLARVQQDFDLPVAHPGSLASPREQLIGIRCNAAALVSLQDIIQELTTACSHVQ